ncbi:hypothetical protein ACFV3R_14145 [Streptomyces sp. NPDC059740]
MNLLPPPPDLDRHARIATVVLAVVFVAAVVVTVVLYLLRH